MKKGQLTIEYLFILVILILLFTNISTDLMQFTSENTLEIQTEQIHKTHNHTLNSMIQSMSIQGPGARQTIAINTPPHCEYGVSASEITLDCMDTPSEAYTGTTIGNIPPDTNVKYEEKTIPAGSVGELIIEKEG